MRKFLNVEYGDMAPEVSIPVECPSLNTNPVARNLYHVASITEFNLNMRKLVIYPKLMNIRTTNTSFVREGYEVPLRIYHPEGNGPFPVLVYIHGGGFVFNNLDVYDYVYRYIAVYGKALVVAVDYRLAPEYKFPIGLEDSYAAVEWASANALKYGGDSSSLSVCGDSAGGNFTAAISVMARDRKGPKIHKQVLIYPLVNHIIEPTTSMKRYGKGYFLDYDSPESLNDIYFNNPEEERNSPYASPMLAKSLSDLPAAVFISAECDILLDQALMYAARLEDEGVAVEYHVYTGMVHSFINYAYGKTFEALNAICASLPQIK